MQTFWYKEEQVCRYSGSYTEKGWQAYRSGIVKAQPVFVEQTINELFRDCDDRCFVDTVRECVLYHHEKWNGSGYPFGRMGAENHIKMP